MAEYANKKTRGSFIAAVFPLQGFEILAEGALAIIVSAGFNSKYDSPAYQKDLERSTARKANFIWWTILLFGAISAEFTYYWLMRMPETNRYTALIKRDANKAAADMSSILNVEIKMGQRWAEEIARTEPGFGLFSRAFARQHNWHLLCQGGLELASVTTPRRR